jgi:hypothetical protein
MNIKLVSATVGVAAILGMIGISVSDLPIALAGSDESCENRDERLEKFATRNDEGNTNNDWGESRVIVKSFTNSACD